MGRGFKVTSVRLNGFNMGMGNEDDNPFERTYEFDGDINVVVDVDVVFVVLFGLSIFEFELH